MSRVGSTVVRFLFAIAAATAGKLLTALEGLGGEPDVRQLEPLGPVAASGQRCGGRREPVPLPPLPHLVCPGRISISPSPFAARAPGRRPLKPPDCARPSPTVHSLFLG
jgi:hypothetical protein